MTERASNPQGSAAPGAPAAPPDAAPGAAPAPAGLDLVAVAKSYGHVSALAVLCASLPAIGGFFALGIVIAKASAWRPRLAEMGLIAPIAYAGAFGVATGLALMPTYALSFISGHLFGFAAGGGAAMAGVALGAMIGYAWAALLARDKVMRRIESNSRHAAVRKAIVERGSAGAVGLVALLRFPPNSPFAITNLVMGATGVRFGPFLLGTLLGMAPRTLFVAYLGAAAATLTEETAKGMPGTWKIVGIGISLAVFAFVIWLCNRWAKRALAEIAPVTPAPEDPALG